MALINGIYIHVIKEEFEREAEISSHTVEQGIDITDTVRVKPKELSLSGKIVNYSLYSVPENPEAAGSVKAWFSLVKKDYGKFDYMSFERLNNELLAFEGGTQWADTGAIQYLDENLTPINAANGSSEVAAVKFEVTMPYGGTVRIQNAYMQYCAFNIINTDATGYNVRDYSSDDEISDIVLSNTDKGLNGRIKTSYTNYYDYNTQSYAPNVTHSAFWIIQQLNAIWEAGALITYEGRNLLENYQIKEFNTSHSNAVAGGADFTMVIREFKAGMNSYGKNESSDDVDASVTSGGVQQIAAGDNAEVRYMVQPGDSVYNLVEADGAPYKNLKRDSINGEAVSAMEWVMAQNYHAFDVYGDYSTLRADVEILLGTR